MQPANSFFVLFFYAKIKTFPLTRISLPFVMSLQSMSLEIFETDSAEGEQNKKNV